MKKNNRGSNWSAEELEFLKNNYGILKPLEIANLLNRNKQSILSKASELKLKALIRPEIIPEILSEEYKHMNLKELARKYRTSKSVIKKFLTGDSIHVHKTLYSVDDNYFEKIDTPNKAYFLGLLYADGCLHFVKNTVSIGLQERDGYILNAFKKDLNSNYPIGLYSRKKIQWKTQQPQYIFKFTNSKIYGDLIKLGCFPQKTFNLKFPSFSQVPQEFIFHFIRGFFDGDGTIGEGVNGRHKNPQFLWSVIGTYEMCNGVNDIFVNLLNLPRQKIAKRGNIWSYSIGGNGNIRTVVEFLYKDAENFLTRKKDKLEKVFNCPLRGQTSKYRGVSWVKATNKWLACTYIKGKQIGLGYFANEEDAKNAYEKFWNER